MHDAHASAPGAFGDSPAIPFPSRSNTARTRIVFAFFFAVLARFGIALPDVRHWTRATAHASRTVGAASSGLLP